jgi:ergothioneine biosynthesis protein EgtC
MCRFVLYMGPPVTLDLLTTRPDHSIIRQSFKSRMRKEPLNGDGFGVAWYAPELSAEPALFRSVQPAWNNINLQHLSRVCRSPVILAHVRAATGFAVSEANCHPFNAGRFAFMHNGSVADFRKIKRRLIEKLSDDVYLWIHGTTDSEHLFALFREHVAQRDDMEPVEAAVEAMSATVADVRDMLKRSNAQVRARLNMAVTDGERSIICRYATPGASAPSLWYRVGDQFVCHKGKCKMLDGNEPRAVIVASEPLTAETEWIEVPENHLMVITPDHRIRFREID